VLLHSDDLQFPAPGQAFWGVGLSARPGWRQPLSGLSGTLVSGGIFRFQMAFAERVSIRIDGSFLEHLRVDSEASDPAPGMDAAADTSDLGPLRVATILRLLPPHRRRPSVGLILATKLPTTDDSKGIGLDTMDFLAGAILDWSGPRGMLAGHVGLGILTSTTTLREQNDVLVWGVKGAWRLGAVWELLGEIQGHTNTRDEVFPGTEDRGAVRFGVGRGRARIRWETVLIQGLTGIDGDLGAGAALSWVWSGGRDSVAGPSTGGER